jgi:hypothetical protein
MNASKMIGNFPAVLNFNRLFSNSTSSFATNCRFSRIIEPYYYNKGTSTNLLLKVIFNPLVASTCRFKNTCRAINEHMKV